MKRVINNFMCMNCAYLLWKTQEIALTVKFYWISDLIVDKESPEFSYQQRRL